MSASSMQAAAFDVEAVRTGSVWTIGDAGGCPAPRDASGSRARPFWSLRSRAALIVQQVPAYRGFTVEEIALDEFRRAWLPGLDGDGIRVGLNWSGGRATGYDLLGVEVETNLAAAGHEDTTEHSD